MSTLTQDCLETHIKNIQCLYKDLVNTYVEKLKIGKVCKEAEQNMLIINEYLDSFYCFEVPLEYINKYRIQVTFTGEPGDPLVIGGFDFTMSNGTDTFTITNNTTYNTDDNPTAREDIITYIITELETLGFTVTDFTTIYIYFQSEETTHEDLEITDVNYIFVEGGPSDDFNIFMIDNGSINEEDILENCLSTDQICCMIAHTYKLLEDCNCDC